MGSLARKINMLLQRDKNNDEIIRLMSNEQLLNHYFCKLIDCLAQDGIFPPHPKYRKKYETADIKEAEAVLNRLKNSQLHLQKQALIWMGLRISVSFVQIFCPPPSVQMERRFLVNPEKLYEMLRGKENPISYQMSRYMCSMGRVPLSHFVSSCMTDWYARLPWLNHEQWARVSPNAPSKELKNIAKRAIIKDNISNSVDADNFIDAPSHAAGMLDY